MGKVVDLEAGKQRRTAAAKGKRRPRRSKTALVLGGGGFTGGVYEIGALRAIDLLSVNRTVNQFDVYVGTSAGAFVASMAANGITPSFVANSSTLGRSSVPISTSENGVGTWPDTTRIISSGVTPLASIAATNEPALVPT